MKKSRLTPNSVPKPIPIRQLAAELRSLAQQDRDLTCTLLARLEEAEARKIHLDLGYPTLFKFCQHELRFSENEAQTRLLAMRLTREVKEARQKLEEGELSLTVAAIAYSVIRRQKIEDKKAFVDSLSGLSVMEARRKVATLYPQEKPPEKTRPISAEYTEISFSANQALMEKFERLKNLWAHRNYSRSYEKLFEEMATRCLAEEERKMRRTASMLKKKRGEIKTKRTRHIPSDIRRAIWLRDKGKCQFQDPITGVQCDSGHGVQVDYIKPYAMGGTHEPENLQLLCGAHNRKKQEELTDSRSRKQSPNRPRGRG